VFEWDFSYSWAAVDKISTDVLRHAFLWDSWACYYVYLVIWHLLIHWCFFCFCFIRFDLCSSKLSDWLGRTSLKWVISCWLRCSTLTQSIHAQPFSDHFYCFLSYLNSCPSVVSEHYRCSRTMNLGDTSVIPINSAHQHRCPEWNQWSLVILTAHNMA